LPRGAGNIYGIVTIKGKAQTGDIVGKYWNAQDGVANLHSNTFAEIMVEKKAKALVGNQYGTKGFWDSDDDSDDSD